jgi:hypothetical protein
MFKKSKPPMKAQWKHEYRVQKECRIFSDSKYCNYDGVIKEETKYLIQNLRVPCKLACYTAKHKAYTLTF